MALRMLSNFSVFFRRLFSVKLMKFVLGGASAAVVDLFFLYFFTHLGIWYVGSAVLAFLVAFGVSFTMQKFWTFKDQSLVYVHRQLASYLAVTICNLVLNTILVYCFVEYFGAHYIFAQIIAGALIAVESYLVYSKVIFKNVNRVSLEKSEL